MKKKRISIITNIAPHYRKSLWMHLLKSKEYEFNFFFGEENSSGIKKIDLSDKDICTYSSRLNQVKNFYFLGRILLWQKSILSQILFSKLDAIIITSDAYVLSNWLSAILIRFYKKQLVFWGHGLYGNENWFSSFIRKSFYHLATNHLVYERRGKKLMVDQGFNPKKIDVIFNSLDYEKSLKLRRKIHINPREKTSGFFKNPNYFTLLFIGRLTKVKKLNLLISAFKTLVSQNLPINLLLIGEGPEKQELVKTVKKDIALKRCHFYGACYDEELLAKLISNSDLCVSPGNIGLTAIHSLSYGTPIATHNNLNNQMPEVGVLEEGKTGIFFEEDNVDSLMQKIKDWMVCGLTREEIKQNCYSVIDTYYNPNYQVKVIENMLRKLDPLM